MIENLISEFLAIVQYLENNEKTLLKKGCLIAEKALISRLLDKNAYETVENKLIAWRGLGWIEADPERLTKRVSINGQTVPAIKIKMGVYEMLKKWTENS